MIRQKIFWPIVVLTLLLIALPYVFAAMRGGDGQVFGGFLVNLADGNSYLAKMRQGWMGEWRFRLPFTAQPGAGAYLFGFYLFLGHVARVLGLSLFVVFHGARLVAAVCLLVVMRLFYETIFEGMRRAAEWAWSLSALGGGMGWVVALLGGALTADFWVAEAYPFLSMYANPHFPLGLACMLGFFILAMRGSHQWFVMAVLGLATGVVLPFGVVVVVVVWGLAASWQSLVEHRLRWKELVLFGLPGGGFVLYQFLATLSDPVLSKWNEQNLTPTPPVWDVVISFSPVLLLAVPGAVWWWKQQRVGKYLLLSWLIAGIGLMYAPLGLQRRFMLGFFIALVGLAAGWLVGVGWSNLRRQLAGGVFLLSLLTGGLILTSGLMAAYTGDSRVYLEKDVVAGMEWLQKHAQSGEIVLADAEYGLLLPGWCGCRVIYGHPFETADASREKYAVESFFAANDPQEMKEFLIQRQISYVFWDGERLALGLDGLPIVFESGKVKILRVENLP